MPVVLQIYSNWSFINITDPFKPEYFECLAEWIDEIEENSELKICLRLPRRPGYDLCLSADNPDYGLLKLLPWRIELGDWYSEPKIWQPPSQVIAGRR